MSDTEKEQEFPVKVGEDIYGPIPLKRIISDVTNGELTDEAKFWDGEDWVPVSILLNNSDLLDEEWNYNQEIIINENGPPLDASSAWEDVKRKGRWIMIYGDHLVFEGGNLSINDLNQIIAGEPKNGGIPLDKLLNVSFTPLDNHIEVKASSFHKMYEVYSLICYLSRENANEIKKELKSANVRILDN